MQRRSNTDAARESILQSIRANLAASVADDALEGELHHAALPSVSTAPALVRDLPLVDWFKESVEAVDGHCVVVENESELTSAVNGIIARLQETNLRARRIAISDGPEVESLVKTLSVDFDEIAVTPSAAAVFSYDVGISRAQAGIAETGTLLLDSSVERHRLVSLVPPVHIAILEERQIVGTLAEALAQLREPEQLTPIATLVTGPSRTADIELTLAIGVHGPQELFVVIVKQDPAN